MSANDAIASPAFGYASRNVTAERLGFSTKRLDQMVAEGWIPKADRGQYDQLAAFQGALAFQRDSARRASKGAADDELKRIRIRRERRKEEVELGKLVPLEDAEFHISQFVGLVRLHINNIPARFTRDLEVRDRLQEAIDEALTSVANGIQKCGAALRADLDADPGGDQDEEN